MYKVVVNTWYESEYICYGEYSRGGELWYRVVESNIPWNNAGKGEYEYYIAREWEVYVELLTGLYTNDFLREVMQHEDFEERLKKLLDEAGVEIEWVDLHLRGKNVKIIC